MRGSSFFSAYNSPPEKSPVVIDILNFDGYLSARSINQFGIQTLFYLDDCTNSSSLVIPILHISIWWIGDRTLCNIEKIKSACGKNNTA
jgi:hypothetical protein